MSLLLHLTTVKPKKVGFDRIPMLVMYFINICLFKDRMLFLVFERDNIPFTTQTHIKRNILSLESKCALTYLKTLDSIIIHLHKHI